MPSLRARNRVIVAAVITTLLVGGGSAAAASPSDDPAVVSSPPSASGMGEYPTTAFADEAASLPVEFVAAIERDLDLTPEEFLARGAAAADAETTLQALAEAGVEVLGASLDGTLFTVHVESDVDAAAVESLGANAEHGVPVTPDFSDVDFELTADLRGGQPYYYEGVGDDGQTTGFRCSLGVIGSSPSGRARVATAGHCTHDRLGNGGVYTSLQMSSPNTVSGRGPDIGPPVSGSFLFGSGYDAGLVDVTAQGWSPRPEVVTWGFGAEAPLASAPMRVRDVTVAIVGAPICKSGSTSGWTCGTVLAVDEGIEVPGDDGANHAIDTIVSSACMLPGDSGGAGLSGGNAVGINSASSWKRDCTRSSPGNAQAVSAFFAMASLDPSVATVANAYGTQWEAAVAIEAPTITSPSANAYMGRTLSGTVPMGNVRHRVEIIVDGSARPIGAVVSGSGTWSIDLGQLAPGLHTYNVKALWGARSVSPTTAGSWFAATVDRLSGDDRYDVAVAVAERAFPNTAATVYVVAGLTYPDALSAAASAVRDRGPILLTPTAALPSAVKDKISRLQPQKIVVVGGPASVSAAVVTELSALAPTRRIGGSDRYAVSRAVADYAFDSATTAYVATGANFPDALAASGAGAAGGSPVILIPGSASTLDLATANLLRSLGVTTVKIAGGPGSVSIGIERDLRRIADVVRLGGADRFEASRSINNDAYSSSDQVYLATGFNFPDALAGAALAGSQAAPMYAVRTACVPPGVIADLGSLGVKRITLLGGPATLTSKVAELTSCG